jgi:hypothetical protein
LPALHNTDELCTHFLFSQNILHVPLSKCIALITWSLPNYPRAPPGQWSPSWIYAHLFPLGPNTVPDTAVFNFTRERNHSPDLRRNECSCT